MPQFGRFFAVQLVYSILVYLYCTTYTRNSTPRGMPGYSHPSSSTFIVATPLLAAWWNDGMMGWIRTRTSTKDRKRRSGSGRRNRPESTVLYRYMYMVQQ